MNALQLAALNNERNLIVPIPSGNGGNDLKIELNDWSDSRNDIEPKLEFKIANKNGSLKSLLNREI